MGGARTKRTADMREYRRNYYLANLEKTREKSRRWREDNPERSWAGTAVSGARNRSKQSGTPFFITVQDVIDVLPDKCPVFGTPFVFLGNGKTCPESPTIDRLKPELGYVKDNIAVISLKANAIKNAYTSDDILAVGQWLKELGY